MTDTEITNLRLDVTQLSEPTKNLHIYH